MKLNNLSKDELETMSFGELSELILAEKGAKMKIVEIFKKICKLLEMSDAEFERMRTYIENKNFAALSDMLESFGDNDATRALKNLSRMFGGIEILENTDGELAYLKELYNGLEKAGVADVVSIDLGLVHQIDYYSGIIIRGYMVFPCSKYLHPP